MENEENLDLEQEESEASDEKKLAPEQELAIKRREFTKLSKELGIEVDRPWVKKPEVKVEVAKPVEKKEFDDTDHLFLDVKGVPEDDREWLWGEVKETGKSLRQILGFNYIQEELKNRKQNRMSEQALPGGNNRSGGTAKDSPEYWLQKLDSGQAKLMDVPSREIRSKIVEIRKQRDQQGPRFTDHPVV